MLRMENLTKQDIEKYSQDTLTSDAYMSALLRRKESKNRAEQLVVDLVAKANGIFLWIALACRSGLTGCAMKDRLPELESRVAEFPEEIGDMFAHMLNKVDEKHQLQCAKYLRICYEAFSNWEERRIPTIGLSIFDELHDDLMGSRLETPSAEDMEHFCTTLEGRLNSRCGGLLELHFKRAAQYSIHTWTFADGVQRYDPIIDTDVVFIHRTVFEFLDSEGSWNLKCLEIPDSSFYPVI
jgi:hypothetical protein